MMLMGEGEIMSCIDSFTGKYRFLSNFYLISTIYEDIEYPSVEHAFQAAKTLNIPYRKQIFTSGRADRAKVLGHRLTLRDDWEQVKIQVMYDCVKSKFTFNQPMFDMLIATGTAQLLEGNNWGDKFWGAVKLKGEWVGGNYLGKILMKVRKEIREYD